MSLEINSGSEHQSIVDCDLLKGMVEEHLETNTGKLLKEPGLSKDTKYKTLY